MQGWTQLPPYTRPLILGMSPPQSFTLHLCIRLWMSLLFSKVNWVFGMFKESGCWQKQLCVVLPSGAISGQLQATVRYWRGWLLDFYHVVDRWSCRILSLWNNQCTKKKGVLLGLPYYHQSGQALHKFQVPHSPTLFWSIWYMNPYTLGSWKLSKQRLDLVSIPRHIYFGCSCAKAIVCRLHWTVSGLGLLCWFMEGAVWKECLISSIDQYILVFLKITCVLRSFH